MLKTKTAKAAKTRRSRKKGDEDSAPVASATEPKKAKAPKADSKPVAEVVETPAENMAPAAEEKAAE